MMLRHHEICKAQSPYWVRWRINDMNKQANFDRNGTSVGILPKVGIAYYDKNRGVSFMEISNQ